MDLVDMSIAQLIKLFLLFCATYMKTNLMKTELCSNNNDDKLDTVNGGTTAKCSAINNNFKLEKALMIS